MSESCDALIRSFFFCVTPGPTQNVSFRSAWKPIHQSRDAAVGAPQPLCAEAAGAAVEDRRHVDVDDVAILELSHVGDACSGPAGRARKLAVRWGGARSARLLRGVCDTVAHHLVDRGADRLWEVVVVERRGVGA